MTTLQRAALIIEVCKHELRNVDKNDLDTLQWAIKTQMDEESLDVLYRHSTSKAGNDLKRELKNFELLKIKKKSKRN